MQKKAAVEMVVCMGLCKRQRAGLANSSRPSNRVKCPPASSLVSKRWGGSPVADSGRSGEFEVSVYCICSTHVRSKLRR
jgi:hypothetical protein